ncbi:sulfatase [Opitutaceae bacterium]|nr:sulfatase [Opitutaceae bacterium]
MSCGDLVAASSQPNLIVIFADDVGYGDLASFGSQKVQSPSIDRLAAEGMRFTDFHVPANVCGPSRAALLTGRHPMRAGHPVARADFPKYMQYGLAPEEVTLAEILKPAGYHSLLVGKWHLGFHVIGSHPLDAGFDEHLGVPSNYAPKVLHHDTLYRGKTVEEREVPFEELTERYTDEVVQFLGREHDAPFFIFMSHHIAHTPIRPSTTFKGRTGHGVYVDFLLELDHSTGRIMQALRDNGLDENTLVVFTSDNGPTPTGDPGGLNGGKYVTMEGGHRVPGIARWPGVIPSGTVSDTTVTSMDLFPLFCDLAEVDLPTDRKIDGRNIRDILQGESTESPHETIAYYNGTNLQAVRQGAWKLHLPRTIDDQPFWSKGKGNNPMKVYLTLDEPLLFNLTEDVGERVNLAARYPEVVKSLLKAAKQVRAELGDVHVRGTDQRPTGLDQPQERLPEPPVQSGPLG